MDKTTKKVNDFNASILKDLESKDQTKMKNAFKKLYSKGNESIIQSLLNLYSSSQNDELKNEIKNTFSQLKTSKAFPILIKNLNHKDNRIKELVLYSIWSSNLDASDHISEIVSVACKGDYMVALEALTLIENLEGPFKEEELLDAVISVNEYLSGKLDNKENLIKSISETLMLLEEQIQI